MYDRSEEPVETEQYDPDEIEPGQIRAHQVEVDGVSSGKGSSQQHDEGKQHKSLKDNELSWLYLELLQSAIGNLGEHKVQKEENPQWNEEEAHLQPELLELALCVEPAEILVVPIDVKESRSNDSH